MALGRGLAYFAFAMIFTLGSCGDAEDSCASRGGKICNNCAQSDCDIQCNAGEQETCVGLEYFDGEPSTLRCAFCD